MLKGLDPLGVASPAGELKDNSAGSYTAALSVRAKSFSLLDGPD